MSHYFEKPQQDIEFDVVLRERDLGMFMVVQNHIYYALSRPTPPNNTFGEKAIYGIDKRDWHNRCGEPQKLSEIITKIYEELVNKGCMKEVGQYVEKVNFTHIDDPAYWGLGVYIGDCTVYELLKDLNDLENIMVIGND